MREVIHNHTWVSVPTFDLPKYFFTICCFSNSCFTTIQLWPTVYFPALLHRVHEIKISQNLESERW